MFFQAGLIGRGYIPDDYLRHGNDVPGVASLMEKNYDSLDFVVVKPKAAILNIQYYLDRANKSPLVEFRHSSDQRYFMCTNSKISLFGSDGNLPLLKYLAAAGRLLVVDIEHSEIYESDRALFSWLRANTYRIERNSAADLYFISPPRISGSYKDSSAAARRQLLLESRVERRVIYPFNRKEWTLHEN